MKRTMNEVKTMGVMDENENYDRESFRFKVTKYIDVNKKKSCWNEKLDRQKSKYEKYVKLKLLVK